METPIVADGSQLEETPHNAGLSNDEGRQTAADQQTLDNTEEESEDRPIDPRQAIMDSVSEQNDSDRAIRPGTRQEDMPAGEPVPEFEADDEQIESGLESQEQMYPSEEVDENALPDEYEDDPLAEFIEMKGDEPMFRTVVNGQQRLIPLEQARTTIQKNVSADVRLQEAHQVHVDLEAREASLKAREAELLARVQKPQPSADVEVDNEVLIQHARDVVGELFTGTQDEAAAKLADLLLETRGAAQAATGMTPEEIANMAVTAAREQLAFESQQKDASSGYKKFVKDYPEIAADDTLFRLADSMTDDIARTHPEWMASEVMMEAGKRTREWVKSQKGENTSEQTPAQDDRRERKRKLRRVPRARQGVQAQAETDRPESPSDFLAELKKARGQVV